VQALRCLLINCPRERPVLYRGAHRPVERDRIRSSRYQAGGAGPPCPRCNAIDDEAALRMPKGYRTKFEEGLAPLAIEAGSGFRRFDPAAGRPPAYHAPGRWNLRHNAS
jgi:hypothetical protein